MRASSSVQISKPCHPGVVPSAYHVNAEITYFIPEALSPSNLRSMPDQAETGPVPLCLSFGNGRYRDCVSSSRPSAARSPTPSPQKPRTVVLHLREEFHLGARPQLLLAMVLLALKGVLSNLSRRHAPALRRGLSITRIHPIICHSRGANLRRPYSSQVAWIYPPREHDYSHFYWFQRLRGPLTHDADIQGQDDAHLAHPLAVPLTH